MVRLFNQASGANFSIARKLLLTIWFAYVVMAILAMSIHLQFIYDQEKRQFDKEMLRTVSTVRTMIARSIWNFDDRQVQKELVGIMNNQYITAVYLQIDGEPPPPDSHAQSDFISSESPVREGGERLGLDTSLAYPVLIRNQRGHATRLENIRALDALLATTPFWNSLYLNQYPIIYTSATEDPKPIGNLYLYSSSHVILKMAFKSMLLTAVSELVRMIILFALTYYLVRGLVTRPMNHLTSALQQLTPRDIELNGEKEASGVPSGVITLDVVDEDQKRKREQLLALVQSREDEVSKVIFEFHNLKEALERKETQLLQYHRNLEKEIEDRTEHLRRVSQAKSDFIAKMSHEIRTPMNGVLGMAELLGGTELDAQQVQYVKTIQSSGKALLSIINDILDFSKIEAGKMELDYTPFDLEQMIDDTVSIFAFESFQKQVALFAFIDKETPMMLVGDPVRIRQILVNFLGNAFKFTHQGQVLIKVSVDKEAKNDQAVEKTEDHGENHTLKFEVIDSGIGIPENKQATIFDLFTQADGSTTRKYGGTGLGLAISKKLANLMQGDIGLISKGGVGSNFWFTVVQEELRDPSILPVERDTSTLVNKHFLVVESNEYVRQLLKLTLEQWGIEVTIANSVGAAVASLSGLEDGGSSRVDVVLISDTLGEKRMVPRYLDTVKNRGVGIQVPTLLLLDSANETVTEQLKKVQSVLQQFKIIEKPVRLQPLREALLSLIDPVMNRGEGDQLRSADHNSRDNRSGNPASGDEQHKRSLGGKQAAFTTVKASRYHQITVLVAEDNHVNQLVILGLLKKLGIKADIADDGQQALSCYADSLAKGAPYDLIFMDCEMPEMDGWEATKRIRELEQATRFETTIIALSAHALTAERTRAETIGMDAFLSKPVSLAHVTAELDKLLERKDGKEV